MKTIALEGLCFAGKSTLAKSLLEHFRERGCTLLQDYSDLADPRGRPPVPSANKFAEIEAFRYYLAIDKKRWTPVSLSSTRHAVVVQDRCFHTLVAHSYSRGKIGRFCAMREIEALLATSKILVQPDVVLYLDASEGVLRERYRTIANSIPDFFKTGEYMRYFREYFDAAFIGTRRALFFLNADMPIPIVKLEALAVLNRLLLW